jgi:hypothetical protein
MLSTENFNILNTEPDIKLSNALIFEYLRKKTCTFLNNLHQLLNQHQWTSHNGVCIYSIDEKKNLCGYITSVYGMSN